jgi:transcriptional regulator of NAD metabolism
MWSIERFEGAFALCEDEQGNRRRLPLQSLPEGAREGDILRPYGQGYRIDSDETARRRAEAGARLERLGALSRRRAILEAIARASDPVSASSLAERFGVSRQVVVGDIALLRASGACILATPRGYLPEQQPSQDTIERIVACCHNSIEQMAKELYLIVDNGGRVLNVTVEHPVYGQISGELQTGSRYDVDRFIRQLTQSDAGPLSMLTGGIHLHTIRCPDEACFARITEALKKAGILLEEDPTQ